jgi:hypothetical protein
MGGVVVWQWKNKYRPDKRPFKVVALVLLGSPLAGSCEPARMLIEGYQAPQQSKMYEQIATQLVFGDAHPAVFTFPSVFQLLPRFDRKSACIELKRGTSEAVLNHFEPGTWFGREEGDYGFLANGGAKLREFATQAGLGVEDYRTRVQRAIEAGRRFRDSFDLRQHNDQVYFLYSDQYKVTQPYSVSVSNSWLAVSRREANVPADSRVPVESAKNEAFFNVSYGKAIQLTREHGALLTDERVGVFVRDTLLPLVAQAKAVEILSFSLDQADLKRDIENRRWVLDPSVASGSLANDPEFQLARMRISAFSLASVAPVAKDPALFARALASTVGSPRTGLVSAQERTAAALLESSLVQNSQGMDARALYQLGIVRLREERYSEAVQSFSLAGEKIPREAVFRADSPLNAAVFEGLAESYAKAGANREADATRAFSRRTPSSTQDWEKLMREFDATTKNQGRTTPNRRPTGYWATVPGGRCVGCM